MPYIMVNKDYISEGRVCAFLLRGIDDDLIDIRPLVVEAVEETSDGDGVLGALF